MTPRSGEEGGGDPRSGHSSSAATGPCPSAPQAPVSPHECPLCHSLQFGRPVNVPAGDGFRPWVFAEAFERNCPGVRLHKDERDELTRLFQVARDEAFTRGRHG